MFSSLFMKERSAWKVGRILMGMLWFNFIFGSKFFKPV